MEVYDDHSYDDIREGGCGKHRENCWCFIWKHPTEADEVCTCPEAKDW